MKKKGFFSKWMAECLWSLGERSFICPHTMADESDTTRSEQVSILSTMPCTEFRLNEYLVYILPHKLLNTIGIHDPYIFLAQCDRDNHGKRGKGCRLETVTIAVSMANSFSHLWFDINMLLNLKLKI